MFEQPPLPDPAYEDVLQARTAIEGVAHRTPVLTSRWLNGLVGAEVFLKCENFQRMGAFKFRGAYNALGSLTPQQRKAGVIAHSSGNHAQAVALAARLLDVSATIVMPKGSPRVKVRATRDTYGAEVVLCSNTLSSRVETTDRIISERGLTLIHPYDDPRVIAGAGTAALELLEDVRDLDVVIVPVGGGGLLSGTCLAARGFDPAVRVVAAEPEAADDAFRSLAEGRIVGNTTADTIADGLRTQLSERTFRIIRDQGARIVTVSERSIVEAMRILWERVKIVVEPSGAVPLAALLHSRAPAGGESIEGARIGLILSGGNVDVRPLFDRLGGPHGASAAPPGP